MTLLPLAKKAKELASQNKINTKMYIKVSLLAVACKELGSCHSHLYKKSPKKKT
jgi:hypothetical protein